MTQIISSWRGHQAVGAERARRAMSLIEVLTVMAVAMFLFGIILSLLHALVQWDRAMRSWSAADGEVERCVDALRDDVRHATDVTCPIDKLVVVDLPDGERIEYRLDEGYCRRRKIGSSETERAEQLFSIGLPGSWQLLKIESGGSPLVKILLKRLPSRETDPAVPEVAVCAVLGADRWTGGVIADGTGSAASESPDESSDLSPAETAPESDEP